MTLCEVGGDADILYCYCNTYINNNNNDIDDEYGNSFNFIIELHGII